MSGAGAEAAEVAESGGAPFGGADAVCAAPAQAIASPPRIKRCNTNDVVRPAIFMRVSSLVQAPRTDRMQGVRIPGYHCSELEEIGIQTRNKVNSRNRELLERFIVGDEELDSGFGGAGEVDCIGGFN